MARKKRSAPEESGAKKKPETTSSATLPNAPDVSTASMKLNAARRAVLETTEILDCILSFLPPKQLFGVQRVSRLWKDIIRRSADMQEKQFLRLQNKLPETWVICECALPAEDGKVPIRMEKINHGRKSEVLYWTRHGAFYDLATPSSDVTFVAVALNPFLQAGIGSGSISDYSKSICDRAQRVRRMSYESMSLCSGVTFGPQSSLLDTYISDPPCKRADVTLTYFASPIREAFLSLKLEASVQTGEALTLRDVLAETLVNRKWNTSELSVKLSPQRGASQQITFGRTSLADIIRNLESDHNCKAILSLRYSSIVPESHADVPVGAFAILQQTLRGVLWYRTTQARTRRCCPRS